MTEKTQWYKTCPKCKGIQFYKQERYLKEAKRENLICLSCRAKTISIEGRKKLSISNSGKHHSIESRKKISKSMSKYDLISKLNSKFQRKRFRHWKCGRMNGFEKYVGLSLNEFKTYISSKFKNGMSWANHGLKTWHLDHIKPLCSFDLKDEAECLKAWNYKNFQPLWAKENLSKGPKF